MFSQDELDKMYVTEQIIKTLSTKDYKDKYVDYETTISSCKECNNYNNNWGCPVFNNNPLDYWSKYETINLILTKIIFTKETRTRPYTFNELEYIVNNTLFKEKKFLIKFLEKEEQDKNGLYLSAGYCDFCPECSRIKDEPCRFPNKCRNSIESIGGLVPDTLKGVFNEEIKWIDTKNGKLPENLSLMMAVLY